MVPDGDAIKTVLPNTELICSSMLAGNHRLGTFQL